MKKNETRNNYDFLGLALGLKDINQRAFRWLQLSLGVQTTAHLCGDLGRVSVASANPRNWLTVSGHQLV